jgi:hypothetical protein
MYSYVKAAVLVFALGLASMGPAAGKSGNSSSATSSGAMGTGRSASGRSTASPRGGSTNRTGGGMYSTFRRAPPLDPKRKISEQDCTKPIVHDAENLRCK